MSESVGQAQNLTPAPLPAPGTLPPITVTASSDESSMSFHTLLSEINPLQYIPVVGTIYRAATGDTIPEEAREVGSLVVSGLIGGPIGVATNLGLLALEKITGIDPEKIGNTLLADIGIGDAAPTAEVASAAAGPGASASTATPAASAAPSAPETVTSAPTPASPPATGSAPVAWSHTQLAAYGVTAGANGELRHGDLRGADVLNDLELTNLAVSG